MIHPSIAELTNNNNVNRYTLVVATAKCARIITEEYVKQREYAEKLALKDGDKKNSAANMINKDYRDEKAVKNALREMKDGKFEIYLPNEEGYEDSIVEVVDYVEPKEEYKPYKQLLLERTVKEDDEEDETGEADVEESAFDDFDSKELMDADEVFTNEEGYTVGDAEDME